MKLLLTLALIFSSSLIFADESNPQLQQLLDANQKLSQQIQENNQLIQKELAKVSVKKKEPRFLLGLGYETRTYNKIGGDSIDPSSPAFWMAYRLSDKLWTQLAYSSSTIDNYPAEQQSATIDHIGITLGYAFDLGQNFTLKPYLGYEINSASTSAQLDSVDQVMLDELGQDDLISGIELQKRIDSFVISLNGQLNSTWSINLGLLL